MITGLVLIIGGLILGLCGSFSFRAGQMFVGLAIAGAGIVMLASRLIPFP